MTQSTRQIIDYAYDDNAKEMRDALYSDIHDRVMAHIEAQKKEVAQSLIAPEQTLQATETPETEETGENA